jgi:hypothetical protein
MSAMSSPLTPPLTHADDFRLGSGKIRLMLIDIYRDVDLIPEKIERNPS